MDQVMEDTEEGIEAGTLPDCINQVVLAYRDTLDTDQPASIKKILGEAEKWLSKDQLANLQIELIATWITWQAKKKLP